MPELKTNFQDTSKATFVVPGDDLSRQKCLAVEEIASDWLKKKCHIYYRRDFALNTIATVYLEELFGFLALMNTRSRDDSDQMISLNGIIDIYTTTKQDEESEKEGNINIAIKFGGLFYYPEDLEKALVEYPYSETDSFQVVIPNPEIYKEMVETLRLIDKLTQKTLGSKYHLIIPQPMVTTTAVSAFVTSVIQWCVDTCTETGKPVLYNISDIIECRCVVRDGEPIIHFVPGEGAKLAIKYDGYTEEE